MPESVNAPWLAKAGDLASHKMMNADVLQGLSLLAIAEAIHRLAAAVEGQASRPAP
jgi:hypothetical protein